MTDPRDKIRKKARRFFIVHDRHEELILGRIGNMSLGGMMLISDDPVEVGRLYHCKLTLPEKVKGVKDFIFDAECRWCKQNKTGGWYEAGYQMRYLTERKIMMIKKITEKWPEQLATPPSPQGAKI